jgi:uncharacterized protein YcnI
MIQPMTRRFNMKRAAPIFTLLAISAMPASAHVVLQNATAAPGTHYKAVLSVPHGCDGSATVKLTVKIPEGFINVKPMAKPGWAIAVTKGKYERSYSYHGTPVAEGATEIVWSGRLDDAFVDEFAFAGFIAETLKDGDVLMLPTVQECDKGTASWTEIAAAGQNPHALKSPAPLLKIAAQAAAAAPQFKIGNLVVDTPWMRATPAGAPVAGAYLKITNTGKEPDRLVTGSIEGAGKFEIHEMSMDNNVMRMRPVPSGLVIKPGETIELKPGGYHGMAMNLSRPFTAGQTIKGTLTFEKAGELAVVYAVGPVGGASGPAEHKH